MEAELEVRNVADLGLIVRARRAELGLTQQQLAVRVGTTRAWVIELEHGRAGSLTTALAAVRELGLLVDVAPRSPADEGAGLDLDAVLQDVPDDGSEP